MKKPAILGWILLLAVTTAFAQKGEVSSAKSGYEQFEGLKGANANLAYSSLDKAKAAIDKATVNEKTSIDPEAWVFRSLIYTGYAQKDSSAASWTAANEAVAALKKAKELDTKGVQKASIDKANDLLYNVFIQKAVRDYQANKYSDAYTTFNTAAVYAGAGRDSIATYYAAVAAQNGKDYANAIQKYTLLLPTKYSYLEDVYSNLSILYAVTKDTASAIRIAGEGAKRFPKNSQLAQREIEFSLMTHKEKETVEKIIAQFAKEPANKNLPYYLGIAYNEMKDPKNAEIYYLKALEIDPSYADASVNLGGLIMNNGIELYKVANGYPANKQAEYAAGMKKANVEFDRALPYLKKATELNPKSELAWKNLKAYYDIKNDKVKSEEIKKKIAEL